MAHHSSGPDFSFPQGDARVHPCDVFAFPKPGGASKSILIIGVHPSVGFNPPGPTTAKPFAPEVVYAPEIDANGDAVADNAYGVRFSSSANGAQIGTVRRLEGRGAAAMGEDGEAIVKHAPHGLCTETPI